MSELNFNINNNSDTKRLKAHFISNIDKLDKSKKTLLMTTPSHTGTSHFRIWTPLLAMAEKYPDAFNYVYFEQEEFPIEWLHEADIWIQHRAGNFHSFHLKMSKLFPIDVSPLVTIHDVDDDEVNLPPTHPMRDVWYATGKDNLAKFQLANVDAITTTTRNLKKEFQKYQKFDNIKIFKNAYDWRMPQWNLEIPKRERITIGWAGLTSHFNDLKKLAVILKTIHDKYPLVDFKIAGIADYTEEYTLHVDADGTKHYTKKKAEKEEDTYKYQVKKLFAEFSPERIEFFGILPLEEYGKFYTMWDINLAYVEHNQFNSRKSEIKIVEGANYENINVYSNIGGYSDFTNSLPADVKGEYIKHCAMRTETVKEWVDAISYWIENFDTDMRRNLVKGVKEFVRKEYDIFNQVDERINYYNELYNKLTKYKK